MFDSLTLLLRTWCEMGHRPGFLGRLEWKVMLLCKEGLTDLQPQFLCHRL